MGLVQHQRFSRCYRLTGPADYRRVFKQARRISGPCFTFLIKANECGHPRLGLIVSRKCARTAVQRNRIKRQVREGFRRQLTRLGDYDIVVMGKPAASGKSNQAIRKQLTKHWTEIG